MVIIAFEPFPLRRASLPLCARCMEAAVGGRGVGRVRTALGTNSVEFEFVEVGDDGLATVRVPRPLAAVLGNRFVRVLVSDLELNRLAWPSDTITITDETDALEEGTETPTVQLAPRHLASPPQTPQTPLEAPLGVAAALVPFTNGLGEAPAAGIPAAAANPGRRPRVQPWARPAE